MDNTTEQIIQLKLGTTYDQVLSNLGAPLKETTIQDVKILRYNSSSQREATFLYFENNELVQKSVSTYQEDETLQKYVTRFGVPLKSIQKFKADAKDENYTIVHLWPEKGIVVITYGLDLNSRVERYQEFSPTTIEKYFQTWGKDLVGNTELKIPGAETYTQSLPTVTPTQAPRQISLWQDKMVTALALQLCFTIVIGLALFVLVIKRQLKR